MGSLKKTEGSRWWRLTSLRKTSVTCIEPVPSPTRRRNISSTTARRLPFKAIIQAAGISMFWRASEASIPNFVGNAMVLAHEKGSSSIAFPLIGAGSRGFKTDRTKAIIEGELGKMDLPIEVRIVVFKDVGSNWLAEENREKVIEMKNYQAIINKELLTSVFGRWPSFHDAEVIWLHFDRRESPLGFGPTVETLIHAFEMTQEVDSNGYYVLRNHVLVHLRFSNVAMPELSDFNHQNAINGLEITDISDRQMEQVKYDVLFEPAFGLGAKFQCRDIEVVSVEPCDYERVGERGGARPVAWWLRIGAE